VVSNHIADAFELLLLPTQGRRSGLVETRPTRSDCFCPVRLFSLKSGRAPCRMKSRYLYTRTNDRARGLALWQLERQ
jgi:hypothetical protein